MVREIDEAWVEEAIARYERIDAKTAEFAKAAARLEVTVRSPDGLVSVVVAGDGTIRSVDIDDFALRGRSGREVAKAVHAAVAAAADAATWARQKLHDETFREYRPLTGG